MKKKKNIQEYVKIKGPQLCEGHLAIILSKDEERLVIDVRRQTFIYNKSHPFENDNRKQTSHGKRFQQQEG